MKHIVIDAMGGDHAPLEVVKGAAEVSLELPDTRLDLVGDRVQIEALLEGFPHNDSRVRIVHATEVIGMDEKPGTALSRKPDASIAVAARLIANGEGQALVSAGNTGASVLACAQNWGLFPGVKRSGFAAVFPTEVRRGAHDDPFSLILDVGATIEASAEDLVTFALMGSAYSRVISKTDHPKVALLSNGTEPSKGPAEVVQAHELLRQIPSVNFVGNIEGLDIPKGSADVIVCSGFVGNVVIKMLEGVAGTVTNLARYAYKESILWRGGLTLLSSGIHRLKKVTDWRQYGGAPLLGFNDIMIKAHGRSTSRPIANAVRVADKAVSSNLHELIRQSIEELKAAGSTP